MIIGFQIDNITMGVQLIPKESNTDYPQVKTG